MYNLELLISALYPFILLYILLFIIILASRYLKAYNRNKTLVLTQDAIAQKRKDIDVAIEKMIASFDGDRSHGGLSEHEEAIIIRILSLYNELAIGINEGIYDELYVKMTLGYDMIDFYKRYGYGISHSIENPLIRFLPLELLLKRWDSEETPSYRMNKRRKML